MTREEEKKKARWEYVNKKLDNPDFPTYNAEYELEAAFNNGAEWADAHPHWISVEDELPKAINITELVLTYSEDRVIRLDRYTHYHHKWVNGASEVTHWMHLPALPSNSEIPNNPGSYKDNEQGFQDAVGEACKWLYNNAPMGIHSEDWNELVEQFRKAMKRGASNETHRTHTAT